MPVPEPPAASPPATPTGSEDPRTAVGRARAYFDRFAPEYDEAARVAGWRLDGLVETALAEVGPVRRVLDLACGTGTTLAELDRALPGARLTGVDVAPAMVARAAGRVPRATVVLADLVGAVAATADGSVDVVTAVGGFEFVPDLPALLGDVRRIVAPGGRLLCTYEPLIDGWPPQALRVETNLGSNGLELTTHRWQPGEVLRGFVGWTVVREVLVAAYERDGAPVVYGWLDLHRPDGAAGRTGPAPAG